MTATRRYIYHANGTFSQTGVWTDEEVGRYREYYTTVTLGVAWSTYHIYASGVYDHDVRSDATHILIYLATNTTYTSGPEYVAPVETKWTDADDINDVITASDDISWSFTGNYNPLEPNTFFKAGDTLAEREDAPEWATGVLTQVNQAVKRTVGDSVIYYECKVAHTTAVNTDPPNAFYWQVLPIWNGHGVNISRGQTNVLLYTISKGIDPDSFEADLNLQFNQGQRHGFNLFAGCSKPNVALSDAGITDGMNIYCLTSQANTIRFDVKKANGTTDNIGGTSGWTANSPATVVSGNNKALLVPVTGYSVGQHSPVIRIHMVHHQGKISLSVNNTKVGTFQYDPAHYPFRRSITGGTVDAGRAVNAGDLIKSRGIHFGLLGGGDSIAATPAHVSIEKACFSTLTLEEFWSI